MMAGRVLLLLLLSTIPAIPHEWYDRECCSDRDCKPVPCDEIKSISEREAVYDGLTFKKILPSKDFQCHACISANRTPYCLYIAGTS